MHIYSVQLRSMGPTSKYICIVLQPGFPERQSVMTDTREFNAASTLSLSFFYVPGSLFAMWMFVLLFTHLYLITEFRKLNAILLQWWGGRAFLDGIMRNEAIWFGCAGPFLVSELNREKIGSLHHPKRCWADASACFNLCVIVEAANKPGGRKEEGRVFQWVGQPEEGTACSQEVASIPPSPAFVALVQATMGGSVLYLQFCRHRSERPYQSACGLSWGKETFGPLPCSKLLLPPSWVWMHHWPANLPAPAQARIGLWVW